MACYHETLSTQPNNSQTNFGSNIGGGAKINLVGPLRLRVDYRVFNLHGIAAPHAGAALLRGD